jgi:hypothetical protein
MRPSRSEDGSSCTCRKTDDERYDNAHDRGAEQYHPEVASDGKVVLAATLDPGVPSRIE